MIAQKKVLLSGKKEALRFEGYKIKYLFFWRMQEHPLRLIVALPLLRFRNSVSSWHTKDSNYRKTALSIFFPNLQSNSLMYIFFHSGKLQ